MVKKVRLIGVSMLIVLACAVMALAADDYKPVSEGGEGRSVLDWPTGVTVYKPADCQNGYTLWVSLGGNGDVHLMDMKGNYVHEWDTHKAPGMHGELLPNGNLIFGARTKNGYGGSKYHMSGKGGELLEYSWDGEKVAEVDNPNAHHDFAKMPNGNYLQILWEKTPDKLAKKLPGGIPGTEHKGGVIMEEIIAETTPGGDRVWEWRASDHLDPKLHPICPLNDRLEWLHINSVDYLPEGNPVIGDEGVLLSLRHTSQIIAVSKKTGKMEWSYGGCMEDEWGKLGAQHDAHVIADGLPGAGHILVFDNGSDLPSVEASGAYWGNDHSRILEIDPKSKKIKWEYAYEDKEWKFPVTRKFAFFSPYISGCQRLANGNTLICDGASGRIFEVTKKGETVWEFINPEHKAIFRALRYTADDPALQGRNLASATAGVAVSATKAPEQEEGKQEEGKQEEEQPAMPSY